MGQQGPSTHAYPRTAATKELTYVVIWLLSDQQQPTCEGAEQSPYF